MPTLADYKAPYPEPTAEQKRFVIYLEPKGGREEVNSYKIQLLPGRIEMVDGANHYFLSGTITEETIEGWGYSYYTVELGPMAGTRMMPTGDDAEQRPAFVRMNNEKLIGYNSKLPIVVLAPKDCILRYKVWHTDDSPSSGSTDGDSSSANEQ